MRYLRIYESEKRGVVDFHPLHGKDELAANSKAAMILADHGYSIELLPNLPPGEIGLRAELLPDVFGSKNPDIRIDNIIIGDIKTPGPATQIRQATINRCIYACAQQKVAVAIINLMEKTYTVQDIKKGIIGALQPDRNKTIREVWIITTRRNLFKANRTMIFDESIYEVLNYL